MSDVEFKFEAFEKGGIPHIRMKDAPFIMSRIVKIQDQQKADSYERKYKVRANCKINDCNIFIIHAGFEKKPSRFITDNEIQIVIDKMCAWYYSNKITKDVVTQRRYKSKSNETKIH